MSTYNHNDYNRYKFIGFQLRTEYFNLSSYKTRNFTQTPLLDPNIGSFSERLNLLDGTLEVDPISFKINENKLRNVDNIKYSFTKVTNKKIVVENYFDVEFEIVKKKEM